MKKTQLKDALRNITKQKVSYLSIILIVTLGVTAYLGINYSAAAMQKAGNDFYNEHNFQDIEMVATLGITEEDVAAVKAVDGVLDAEGIQSTTAVIEKKNKHIDVNVFSMTERLNQPMIFEGILPQSADECALEETLMDEIGLLVGDTVSLSSGTGKTPKYLRQQEYTVTAKIRYADHIKEASYINSTVLVSKDAFDMRDEYDSENSEMYYTRLAVRLDCGERNAFSDRYFSSIEDTKKKLQTLSEERAAVRDRQIEERIASVISEKELTLDDARSELDDAGKKISDGETELEQSASEIEENRQKLNNAKEELDNAKVQLNEGKHQLDENRQKLDDAKSQLNEANTELDTAKKELDDGKKQLDEAKLKIEEGQKQIDEAKQQINNAQEELDTAKVQLDENKEKLDEGKAQIDKGIDELDKSKTEFEAAITGMLENTMRTYGITGYSGEIFFTYGSTFDQELIYNLIANGLTLEAADNAVEFAKSRSEYKQAEESFNKIFSAKLDLDYAQFEYTAKKSKYDRAYAEYEKGLEELGIAKAEYDSSVAEFARKKAEYDSGLEEYEKNKAEYDSRLAEYNTKKGEYEDGETEYAAGLAEFDTKNKEYEDALVEGEEGVKKLAEAEAKYASSEQELADGKKKYEDGMDEYANAVNELDNKKQQLENVEQCRWFQFDLNSNLGYVSLDMNAGSLAKLGKSFALLFVVVGAMVCYATIGRMVDEQRKLVGASKALGLFSSEIFKKYIFFGLSAVFIGILLGIAGAYFGVQKAILMGNAATFSFGEAKPVLVISKTVVVMIFGLEMGFAATYIACARLLRSTAVVLMKEKVPHSVKTKGNGRKAGTLYSRLIVRNMLSDLKRVAVTVISIAGCCSLLVIGFTLKSSVDKVIVRQFEEIITYDNDITFSSERSTTAASDISEILNAHGCSYTELAKEFISCRFSEQNDAVEIYIIDPAAVEGYYDLRDAESNEKIQPTDWKDGVLIQKRVAEVCNVKAGDSIVLYDSNAKEHEAKIAGVFDNYIGRTMFMSDGYYEQLFGTPVRNNQFFVKLNGADADQIEKEVSNVKGYKSFSRSDSQKDFFNSISVILNAVIAGMIFMSAMMASVVLLNLTNMYLTQKKRELAIMRINGFTVGQTIGYLARETVITTVIGIALGIAAGSALALQIIHSMEKPSMQLVRDYDYIAWALSAIITALFAFIINYIVMRKVKKLRLADLAG